MTEYKVIYRRNGLGPMTVYIKAKDELNAAMKLGQSFGSSTFNTPEVEIISVAKDE